MMENQKMSCSIMQISFMDYLLHGFFLYLHLSKLKMHLRINIFSSNKAGNKTFAKQIHTKKILHPEVLLIMNILQKSLPFTTLQKGCGLTEYKKQFFNSKGKTRYRFSTH